MPRHRRYADPADRKRAQRRRDAAGGGARLDVTLCPEAVQALRAIEKADPTPRTGIVNRLLLEYKSAVRLSLRASAALDQIARRTGDSPERILDKALNDLLANVQRVKPRAKRARAQASDTVNLFDEQVLPSPNKRRSRS